MDDDQENKLATAIDASRKTALSMRGRRGRSRIPRGVPGRVVVEAALLICDVAAVSRRRPASTATETRRDGRPKLVCGVLEQK